MSHKINSVGLQTMTFGGWSFGKRQKNKATDAVPQLPAGHTDALDVVSSDPDFSYNAWDDEFFRKALSEHYFGDSAHDWPAVIEALDANQPAFNPRRAYLENLMSQKEQADLLALVNLIKTNVIQAGVTQEPSVAQVIKTFVILTDELTQRYQALTYKIVRGQQRNSQFRVYDSPESSIMIDARRRGLIDQEDLLKHYPNAQHAQVLQVMRHLEKMGVLESTLPLSPTCWFKAGCLLKALVSSGTIDRLIARQQADIGKIPGQTSLLDDSP